MNDQIRVTEENQALLREIRDALREVRDGQKTLVSILRGQASVQKNIEYDTFRARREARYR